MAALRGPDSSEDERRLGEQAVFPETVESIFASSTPFPHLAPSSRSSRSPMR